MCLVGLSWFSFLLASSIIFNWIYKVKGNDGCRDLNYLDCIKNKTLVGHVIDSIKMATPILQNCQNQCFNNKKCISYNLGEVDGMIRLCELNAADYMSRPTFFVDKPGHEHCPIQNPCLSKPCEIERFCKPDFDWNTYSCNDGEWSQWGTWNGVRGVGQSNVLTRTRTCTDPPPHSNGLTCDGPANETKPCIPLIEVNSSGCASPLGMENGSIPDNQITQSSYSENVGAHLGRNGRLNKQTTSTGIGGWAAGGEKIGEFLQVDLGGPKIITMVASQGRHAVNQWVTKYSLSYSDDGNKWIDYELNCSEIFPANIDWDTTVTNKLTVPIKARHIRVIVQGFFGHPTLRVEFYGCSQ